MYQKAFEYNLNGLEEEFVQYQIILPKEARSFLKNNVEIVKYHPDAGPIEEIIGWALGQALCIEGNYLWCDIETFKEKKCPSFCPEVINYFDSAGDEHFTQIATPPEYLEPVCFFNTFDLQIDGLPIRGTLTLRLLSDSLSQRELNMGWYYEDKLEAVLLDEKSSPELISLAKRLLEY